ncbi:hypothetical protein PCASD_13794 [Puccinia coronata f. sp. avenae]|uniref:Uncharacterized protein n=1 Tax=Puccinia coronata f. sp. avenae TaxID=200324 RepID=A0A2N5S6Y5_9BASI|nr:hypothetical protein PCASD_25385 [Puccinia coronata f. sp. avenae]PLW36013.1 hypothetical protein PCASD_13794 [Puccinia coronata f. sp. avenae]
MDNQSTHAHDMKSRHIIILMSMYQHPASPEQSWKSLLRSGHTPDSIHPSNQPHILKLAIKYLINMLWLVSAVPPRFTRKLNIGEAVQMSKSFAGGPSI